jgi:arylsulfatase A-like enzyme
MTNRRLILATLLLALLASRDLRANESAITPPRDKKPNIVVILADDLGWNAVGYHDGFVPTPNVDRIANQGVQLDRFYVSPMCSPTRAGLMTGRYALQLGLAVPWFFRGSGTA